MECFRNRNGERKESWLGPASDDIITYSPLPKVSSRPSWDDITVPFITAAPEFSPSRQIQMLLVIIQIYAILSKF